VSKYPPVLCQPSRSHSKAGGTPGARNPIDASSGMERPVLKRTRSFLWNHSLRGDDLCDFYFLAARVDCHHRRLLDLRRIGRDKKVCSMFFILVSAVFGGDASCRRDPLKKFTDLVWNIES
jgi:hypothetical protein